MKTTESNDGKNEVFGPKALPNINGNPSIDNKYSDNEVVCNCTCLRLPNQYKKRVDESMNHSRTLIKRTYEPPYKWYNLVFTPLNKGYNAELYDKHALSKITDRLRKLNPKVIITTKEKLDCNKVHINVLMCIDLKVEDLNGTVQSFPKKNMQFRVYSEECRDRHDCLSYIFKEIRSRRFDLYKDYIVYPKP